MSTVDLPTLIIQFEIENETAKSFTRSLQQSKMKTTMSYLSEYIIPGNLGKTFLLGANHSINYQKVIKALREIRGVINVSLNEEVFPREVTVFTERAIPVSEIQKKVRTTGFNAIAKATFLF